jgi:uncharacterized protein YecE (DUF72 family)
MTVDRGAGCWSSWPYRIGCPVWSCKAWVDSVYPRRTPPKDSLWWYSRMFATVEGNSTFYALPSQEVFQGWAASCSPGFEFCFKFPRGITHEAELLGCDGLLGMFLERLTVLDRQQCLGPTFLQLSPQFSGRYRQRLEDFLRKLPSQFPWAVEVRHADWFDEGPCERWLDSLLEELGIDRVLLDSRPLYRLPPRDPSEAESQRRKPRSPWRTTVTARAPFVRLIGRNRWEEVADFWESWAEQVASWIRQGFRPRIFTHAPDDAFAPQLARYFHELLKQKFAGLQAVHPIPTLPDLEGNRSARSKSEAGLACPPRQLKLFED